MSAYPGSGNRGANKILDRAFAAGAALSVGVVAVTGIFVAKIVHSYAATHRDTTVSGTDQGGRTGDSSTGSGSDGGDGAGQLSVPQPNQQPAGGSNGS